MRIKVPYHSRLEKELEKVSYVSNKKGDLNIIKSP